MDVGGAWPGSVSISSEKEPSNNTPVSAGKAHQNTSLLQLYNSRETAGQRSPSLPPKPHPLKLGDLGIVGAAFIL